MSSLLAAALIFLVACTSQSPPAESQSRIEPAAALSAKAVALPPAKEPSAEPIGGDRPKTTVAGNTFVAPAGWIITVRGQVTLLEPPEAGSRIALIDVVAKDAEAALALAWTAYGGERKWPLKVANNLPDRDGWTGIRRHVYQTSPDEKREVAATTQLANGTWTIEISDMAEAVREKRFAQVLLIVGRLLPKGRQRESFAGKTANQLDAARLAELSKFVTTAQQALGVPGVSIGLAQGGMVVFAGGFGVRELGKKAPVDAETRYIIASNTKALTTLMLAKLVDEKQLTWETTAKSLLPEFQLGDANMTNRVLVKHLICACTGMPRQDLEAIFQFGSVTPDGVLKTLGMMQPTSKFGELFQYSNLLAAAAGFIGGHVVFPKLEFGQAYDQAMRTRVFEPLSMKATTFDFKRAQTGNYAHPHAQDLDGKTRPALASLNDLLIPVRPAGGAWSNINDMLRYVQMELAEGKLPDGKQYLAKEPLLARRTPQVALGTDGSYGMGLVVDKTWGVTVVHHGGDVRGFHSDMMWLPEHGVGAVVLTNGDPGWLIRSVYRRKLLEVLFDGHAEADSEIAAQGKAYLEHLAAERKLLTAPADATESAKLAARYSNAALGDIQVSRVNGATIFDFGEWRSEVASRKNPDGSVSFLTTAPGSMGMQFLVGRGAKRTLIIHDAQHEYVFNES